MDLHTVYALSGSLVLAGHLALTSHQSSSPPRRLLHRSALRAGLVLLAVAFTAASGFHGIWPSTVALVLLWLATALLGHTLLEDLSAYRQDITTQPLPADQED